MLTARHCAQVRAITRISLLLFTLMRTSTFAPALRSSCTSSSLPSCAATMRGVSLVSVFASMLAPLPRKWCRAREEQPLLLPSSLVGSFCCILSRSGHCVRLCAVFADPLRDAAFRTTGSQESGIAKTFCKLALHYDVRERYEHVTIFTIHLCLWLSQTVSSPLDHTASHREGHSGGLSVGRWPQLEPPYCCLSKGGTALPRWNTRCEQRLKVDDKFFISHFNLAPFRLRTAVIRTGYVHEATLPLVGLICV